MMSVDEVKRRLQIGRAAIERWPDDSKQWNYHSGYVRALLEVLDEDVEITARDGLLYWNDEVIDCQTADVLARERGFRFAEELVAALSEESP